MSPPTRWIIALATVLLVGHAAALQPADGTEVVVTDAAGHQLVGYGVVQNGQLLLRLAGGADQFVLLLVAPDGTVQRFDGVRGAGGALLVDQPDGSRQRLSSMLGRADIALRVVPQHTGGVRAGSGGTSGSSGSGASSGSASGDNGSGGSGGSSDSGSSGDGSSSGDSNNSTNGGSSSPPTGDSGSTDGP